MSAAFTPADGASSPALRAPADGPPIADEALDTLLPRYARLGRRLADAEACVVRVRRGGERWHTAECDGGDAGVAGDTGGVAADPDGAFGERVRRSGQATREGDLVGLPIGDLGSLVMRMAPGRTLEAAAERDLRDLVALVCREVGGGTERAAAAEAARAAAVEVEHQMRNGFAKINAMIDLAAREGLSDADLVATLKRRLTALGEANEVAIAFGFGPAPLDMVVRAALSAALGRMHGDELVVLDGEPLVVSPAVASVLAPIFAELAADAAARGRLDHAAPIRLRWSVNAERGRAVFRWEEGVASETEPFASAFLRGGGPSTLRGEAIIDAGHGQAGGGAAYQLAVPERFVSRPDGA